jgi:RAB protein geranylgeranyltransferase component A
MTLTMTTLAPPEAEQEERGPPRDEEGLLLHYDVVLCGTGLVQSILASALARAGKSVLHCDGNDYYGEYDAVLPFNFDWKQSSETQQKVLQDDFSLRPHSGVRLHSSETLTQMPTKLGTIVSTPYGDGEVISIPENDNDASTVSIRLNNWTLANGVSPILHVGIPCDGSVSWEEHLLTLNIIPSRLRKAQQVLQQKRSFAFDMTPSLLYASGPAVKALLTSGVADYMEFKALEGLLWFGNDGLSRVPCSKGDVFGTSLLSPLEKRRFMKFLQLTLDYATAQQQREHADIVDTSNDDNTTHSLVEVQSLNEHHLNQGRSLARPQNKAIATSDLQILNDSLDKMPFAEYLAVNAKLSANLIKIVQYALALEPRSNLSTRQGMSQLCQHVQSLGRFGTTAFIVPIYGSGELSQSFCRSAAVHGATYLLRRSPKRVIVQNNKVSGIQLSNPEDDNGDKLIPCDSIILDSHAIAPLSSERVYRRISVVLGKVLDDQHEQRHVVIVPPGKMSNTCAIHGLVLDEAVGVAPSGCTILHLTTTGNAEEADSVLEEFVKELKADEIFHVSFSYPLPVEKYSMENVEGLHVFSSLGQSLTLDNQVEEARCIFHSICPDIEFLTMSQKMDEIVKERFAGREVEDDEERMVLESAMKMMDITDDST